MEFGLSCLLGVSEEGGRSRTGQKCSRDAGLQSHGGCSGAAVGVAGPWDPCLSLSPERAEGIWSWDRPCRI